MRALVTLLTGLLAAAVIVCAFVVASARLSEAHWVLDLAGQFQLAALWALMVSAVLLVLAMPFSRKRFLNLFFANFAVIIAALGWYWIWPVGADTASETAITVHQHNIWGNHPDPSRPVVGAVESGADLVVLIEAYDGEISAFESDLQRVYPYQSAQLHRGQSSGGLKLYSRFEIVAAEAQPARGSPAMLRARVSSPEGELTVLVIHFTRPWPFDRPDAQLRQLAGLAREIESIDGPLIILGDVNSAAWGRIAGPLEREYGFELVSNPRAGTWPSRMPVKYDVPSVDWPPALSIPIDLAFCRGAIACSDHRVGDHFGSDHRSATFKVSMEQAGTGAR